MCSSVPLFENHNIQYDNNVATNSTDYLHQDFDIQNVLDENKCMYLCSFHHLLVKKIPVF